MTCRVAAQLKIHVFCVIRQDPALNFLPVTVSILCNALKIGVVSHGHHPCATSPTVYSRVTATLDWIKGILAEDSATFCPPI